MQLRADAPCWGFRATLALVLVCAAVVPAAAQPHRGVTATPAVAGKADKAEKGDKADKADKADKEKKGEKVKNFNFDALDLNGRNRTPQLLYFLERANEELERATLEKRSFIPSMVRSVDEEAL